MDRIFDHNEAQCRYAQGMLSEYVDNALSARQTWELEKHLTSCSECTAQLQQLRTTVSLLHAAEQFDTSHDFMAKLHARLDDLEPEPARNSPVSAIRGRLEEVWGLLRTRRSPVLGLGMALAGVAALVIVMLPLTPTTEAPKSLPAAVSPQVAQALERQVAASASDPLGDAAAEKLTAQDGLNDDTADSTAD